MAAGRAVALGGGGDGGVAHVGRGESVAAAVGAAVARGLVRTDAGGRGVLLRRAAASDVGLPLCGSCDVACGRVGLRWRQGVRFLLGGGGDGGVAHVGKGGESVAAAVGAAVARGLVRRCAGGRGVLPSARGGE